MSLVLAPKSKTPNGGDVWVLLITDTKPTDSDLYICEVNSNPPIKSFHSLKVKALSKATAPKSGSNSTSSTSEADDPIELDEYVHDFTDCCKSMNVSSKCLGFCTIHNIIDGTAGVEPDICETDFPQIVKCMADGRNHLPCCERKKIPDVCQVDCSIHSKPNKIKKKKVSVAHYLLIAGHVSRHIYTIL